MKNITFIFLIMGFFLIFSPSASLLCAEEIVTAEDFTEAPDHILDMKLGDVGTDVFWQGYWRYRVAYGTGWENGSDGFVFPAAFPDMQYGLEFSQEPDFFLSVLLLDHYFLETSFTEGYDKNTYVMGYKGDEYSPVKEVRIGNAGIGIGEYEGIDVSSPEYNTPGVSGHFQTEQSEHEFMIRYDPTEEQSKSFLGGYEVTEEIIQITDYQEGRYFILPNREISTLTVYQETEQGEYSGSDGRRYTELDTGFRIDLKEGILTLETASEKRVALFYRSGGSEVGDSALAEDFIMDTDRKGRPDPSLPLLPFSWDETDPYNPDSLTFRETSLVSIDGNETLLVHRPHTYSPFQSYNRYTYNSSLPDESWKTDIALLDKGAETDEDAEYTFLPDDYVLTVLVTGEDERESINRVPFFKANPEIYGPGKTTDESKLSRKIVLSVKENAGDYFLGSGLIKGSVKVKVNGLEDQTVTVDYDTGELQFNRYIFPDDRIEVAYRTESAGLSGGDLFMAQGNRLNLTPGMKLELAESLRWTIPESRMTEEEGESPGIVDLAATWFYDRENLNMKIGAGLNLTTADTAGNFRIMGMEESGYSFAISMDQLVPPEYNLTPANSSCDPADRVDLIYRDFVTTTNLGQTYLNSYTWDAPVDEDEQGPSLAAAVSDDPFSSRVMVMTYNLEGDDWAAGDYLPVTGELIDLSGYSELSFYLRRQNLGEDDLKVTLLLGENGENEDNDDSGSVDRGNSSYLIERLITLPRTENRWEKVTLPLTSSERQKLSRVRSYRFLLENTNSVSGESSGELLAAGFSGEGSPLLMKVLDAEGNEQEGKNLDAVEVEDSTLETAFPDVSSLFHPEDETQKILKVSWGDDSRDGTALAADESWSGTAWMEGVDPSNYGILSLYIRHGRTGGTGYISLTDNDGKGIRLSYEPGGTDWEQLKVNLREGTASFSGSSSVSNLGIDKDAAELTRFEIGMSDLASGTLLLDELHFSDPVFSTAATAEYTVEYARPGDILLTAGGFPILKNFNVYNRVNYFTEERDSLFSDRSNQVESQLSSGIDFMNVRLEGDFDLLRNETDTFYSGGHLVRLPSSSSFGWVSDRYSRSFHPGDDVMERENILYLTPFSLLTLQGSTGSDGSDEQILQKWGGWITLKPFDAGSIRLSLDLYQTAAWESDSSDYFSDWAADFKYVRPLQEDIESREGFGRGTFTLTGEVFGINWEPALEYRAEEEYEWVQENRWESELSFPLTFQSSRGEWTLKPGYSRELENTLYPGDHRDFRDDMDTLFRGIESQFPLWNFVPFHEIFSDDSMNAFEETLTLTDESSYTPTVFLSLSRMPGSYLSDLFLPSSMDISMDREYIKDQDTLYRENHWEFQLIQSALNIFGDWGSTPLFRFYKTDEWTSSIQYVMSGRKSWAPEPEELTYQNYISLMGEEMWDIALDNSFTVDFEDELKQDDLQLIFSWREPENAWINIPLFDHLIVKSNHMEHREKLVFTGYFDGEDQDNTTYDTILTHESRLVVDDLGSLKGWMSLGLGGKHEVFRNAYELGVELEITF